MTKNIIVSQEAYKDQFKLDVENAFELCNSMEAIYTMYQNNLNTKLNMLNKINKVYGKSSRGIENYCRIQSLEADETSTTTTPNDAIPGASKDVASGTDSSNGSNTQNNAEKNSKTAEMLHKVHETIANLLTKLFQWIMDLINKFRYNNKVFENTINTINNASEEDLNKVSDDLKNVEFDGKNLILISKHPQQNLQKFMGSYQLLSDTFGNAIQAAISNPKDYGKVKDFSAKLKDFIKSVPDVGNTCPTLEGDGIDTIKQYTDALKSFNNQGLNYNQKLKSFNSYYGGTDTFDDKVTVGKVTGNVDPKTIVTIIKTESAEIGKFSESLGKINETNKKNGKGINDLFNKMKIGGDNIDNIKAQCNLLTVCEKTLAQINSIFCGICSNSIKTINVVKGKLVDFTKKNVNTKKEENKNNENKTEETKESLYIDYQFDNFMKSLENMQDLQFTEMYSVEDVIEVSSKIPKRNPIVVIKELFKKIWKSLVNYVNNIIQKISEYWNSKRLNNAYKKASKSDDKQRLEVLTFANDAQILLRRMNKTVEKVNEVNDHIQNDWIKQMSKINDNNKITVSFFANSVAIMKIFVMLEKIVYKSFGKFRNNVIKGDIKKIGNNSIEKFASSFDMLSNKYMITYRKFISKVNNNDIITSEVETFANDFSSICKDANKLIGEYTGHNFKILITTTNGKVANMNLNIVLDELEQKLNEPATLDYVGKKLFGIVSTEETPAA